MREAVIVSTARTPIGKAYRGAFNDTSAQELAGHAIEKAVERAGIEPNEVSDVIMELPYNKDLAEVTLLTSCYKSRITRYSPRNVYRSSMRKWHDGYCDGSETNN